MLDLQSPATSRFRVSGPRCMEASLKKISVQSLSMAFPHSPHGPPFQLQIRVTIHNPLYGMLWGDSPHNPKRQPFGSLRSMYSIIAYLGSRYEYVNVYGSSTLRTVYNNHTLRTRHSCKCAWLLSEFIIVMNSGSLGHLWYA